MMAIAVYAGFNAALLIVAGMLMTFSRQTAGSAGWRIPLGLVILTVGVLLGAAIVGLWTHRQWGRKILCWGLLFCIPLNALAIFPILQNHRMTTGNTILQIACMAASLFTVFHLYRAPAPEMLPEQTLSEYIDEADDEAAAEEKAFTFDRRGRSDLSDL